MTLSEVTLEEMRILFATYAMAFQNPGGGERVQLDLMKALIKRGHDIEIYSPWRHEVSRFDLIHYFSTGEHSMWEAFKALAPLTHLCVTPTFQKPRHGMKFIFSRVFNKIINRGSYFEKPDFYFPTTDAEAFNLKKYLGVPKGKMKVIKNGVNPHFLHADPAFFRGQTGIKGPFILHVGRFDPVKNHFKIIKVAKKLKAQLVFIGDPNMDQMDYYQKCKEKCVPNQTFFFPAVSNEDPFLASAYAACSVFLMPSLFETFGIAALEAALAGAPVVVTKNILSRREFASFAEFVDPLDCDKIANAVRPFLKQEFHQSLDFRKNLLTKYSWDTIAGHLEQVYLRL